VAETQKDLEEVMVFGDSGIASVFPPHQKPTITRKPVRIEFHTGALALGYNATEPDQLRGPQFDRAWCFNSHTLIATEDGERRIDSVKPGDLVWTRKGLRAVVANASRSANVGRVIFSNGKELIGTADHPVYTPHGWTRLGQLQRGDAACAINVSSGVESSGTAITAGVASGVGLETSVASVVSTWQPMGEQDVFCLKVEGEPEYFANSILVHNCDEMAKWYHARETWDMLQFGLRLGDKPRQVVTTTPRPIPVLKEIMADPHTVVTRGSTFDNRSNLAPSFFDQIVKRYSGTRIGRQEISGEILDDVPGAIFTRAMLDAAKVQNKPDMQRVVVAVDPSGTSGDDEGDSVGIVVAGLGVDGLGYVLADRTCRLGPAGWGRRVVDAYHEFQADRIVAERNYGGAMVEAVIRTADRSVSYRDVFASRGKVQRAEPVAALFEQNRVKLIGSFPDLEDELCSFTNEGYVGDGSPNRGDAAVWAITDLMVQKSAPVAASGVSRFG